MMFTTAHFTIHMSGQLHLPHQPCGGKRSFGVHFATATLHAVTDDPLVYIQSDVIHRFHRGAVLLNNAGGSLIGTVEEASDDQIHALFEANYFGMVRVVRAALPLLRQQGSGHILGVSSGLGIVAMPLSGFYCATKWAVEALHESLVLEVKAFGIKATLIEPVPTQLNLEVGEDR